MEMASLLKYPGKEKGLKAKVKLVTSGQPIIWDWCVLRVLEVAVQDQGVAGLVSPKASLLGLWMAVLFLCPCDLPSASVGDLLTMPT